MKKLGVMFTFLAAVMVASMGLLMSGCSRQAAAGDYDLRHPLPQPQIVGERDFTFNGKVQGPQFCELLGLDGLNIRDYVIIGGTQSAVHAGDYYVTIQFLEPDYFRWAGQYSQTLTFNWSIQRADLATAIKSVQGTTVVFQDGWDASQFTISFSQNQAPNSWNSTAWWAFAPATGYTTHYFYVKIDCVDGNNFIQPKIVRTYLVVYACDNCNC